MAVTWLRRGAWVACAAWAVSWLVRGLAEGSAFLAVFGAALAGLCLGAAWRVRP